MVLTLILEMTYIFQNVRKEIKLINKIALIHDQETVNRIFIIILM